MWNTRRRVEVAVAINKDKSSQHALQWALDHIVTTHTSLKLIHVHVKPTAADQPRDDSHIMDLVLAFQMLCARRDAEFEVVVLEDPDVAVTLARYVLQYRIQSLLLGASSRNAISRMFKNIEIPGNVLKLAPDFCNVYIISKKKVEAIKPATRIAPPPSPLAPVNLIDHEAASVISLSKETDEMYNQSPAPGSEISLLSPKSDSTLYSFYEQLDFRFTGDKYSGYKSPAERRQWTLQNIDGDDDDGHDKENETVRLKRLLKQSREMYHAACKEALAAKAKAIRLEEWKKKEEVIRKEEQVALTLMVEKDMRRGEMMKEIELQKRIIAEMGARKDKKMMKQQVLDAYSYGSLSLLILAFLLLFTLYVFSSKLMEYQLDGGSGK